MIQRYAALWPGPWLDFAMFFFGGFRGSHGRANIKTQISLPGEGIPDVVSVHKVDDPRN